VVEGRVSCRALHRRHGGDDGLLARTGRAFVSLLFAEVRTVIEIAASGALAVNALSTCGHVSEELEGAEPRLPAQAVVRKTDVDG